MIPLPDPATRLAPLAGAALLVALSLTPAAQSQVQPAPFLGEEGSGDGVWNRAKGMATKSGYRLVFAWDADEPVAAHVEWGYGPDALDRVARPSDPAPDTAGLAVADVPRDRVGETVHYRVVDAVTGQYTTVRSFPATNGWTSNGSDGVHDVDLLVQVDTEALPSQVPVDQGLRDLVLALDVAAERIWDATDESVRVDDAIVTDTALNYPLNVPFGLPLEGGPFCPRSVQVQGASVQHTVPDVLVESSLPFDSHTYRKAMDDPCRGIYLGRIGQLVLPWGSAGGGYESVHVGQVLAHEIGHYALDLPDLYPTASTGDCWAGTSGTPGEGDNYDISMMHNAFGWDGDRWRGSEIDRGPNVTPCDYGSEPASWPLLADLYPAVPTISSLQDNGSARPVHDDSDHTRRVGNPDGPPNSDGFDAFVLDNQPPRSRFSTATSGGAGPTDLPAVFPDVDAALP